MKTIKGFVKNTGLQCIDICRISTVILLCGRCENAESIFVSTTEKIVAAFESNKRSNAYKYACFFQITHPISISFFSDCSYIWYNHGIK